MLLSLLVALFITPRPAEASSVNSGHEALSAAAQVAEGKARLDSVSAALCAPWSVSQAEATLETVARLCAPTATSLWISRRQAKNVVRDLQLIALDTTLTPTTRLEVIAATLNALSGEPLDQQADDAALKADSAPPRRYLRASLDFAFMAMRDKSNDKLFDLAPMLGPGLGAAVGIPLSKRTPDYLEVGLRWQYYTCNYVLTTLNEQGEPVEKPAVSYEHHDLQVPIRYTHRFRLAPRVRLQPLAGLNLKLNLKSDFDGFNRFQLAANIGLLLTIRHFCIGYIFLPDFLQYVDDALGTMQHQIHLGIDFHK